MFLLMFFRFDFINLNFYISYQIIIKKYLLIATIIMKLRGKKKRTEKKSYHIFLIKKKKETYSNFRSVFKGLDGCY